MKYRTLQEFLNDLTLDDMLFGLRIGLRFVVEDGIVRGVVSETDSDVMMGGLTEWR